MEKQIAIATCNKIPELSDSEQYLMPALKELGIDASPVVWNQPSVPWEQFSGVLIRTIWDYHKDYQSYLQWLTHLEILGLPVCNSIELLRWNSHKSYLKRFEAAGIRIPATLFLDKPDDLGGMEPPWDSLIIKPAVSATAFETYHLSRDEWSGFLPKLRRLCETHDMLIQQYMTSIASEGEWSLIFFNHRFSHAVLKTAKQGDFRVQGDFGGSVQMLEPDRELIQFGEQVLAELDQQAVYARVDVVIEQGSVMLMELELIEPELFLLSEDIRQRFLASVVGYFDAWSE